MGVRASVIHSRVVGSDHVASEDYKRDRGYSYKNYITEGSLLFEYNFFDINDEHGKNHSPYIFAGIGAFMYNENKYTVENTFARNENGTIKIGRASCRERVKSKVGEVIVRDRRKET